MRLLSSFRKFTTPLAITSLLVLVGNPGVQSQSNSNYGKYIQNNTVCSFITANNVNVRSGASNRYKVVAKLNRGDGVRAIQRKGNWVEIAATSSGIVPKETYQPLKGWVYNAYINGCSEDQFDRWRS